jgi:hypothetical protein
MDTKMIKLNNYIYYSICEKSLELMNETVYRNYSDFCEYLRNSILLESLGRFDMRIFRGLNQYLKIVYGFDIGVANEYIVDFFINKKWEIFEESVKLMKSAFPNSFH